MIFEKLFFLEGCWEGKGIAKYPSIEAVEYEEELIFKKNNVFPLFHYEQKSWVKNDKGIFDVPIFWETGFIIQKDSETFEICSAQKSGRAEILHGNLVSSQKENLEINFHSDFIINDDRLINSSRKFILSENFFEYELWMTTKNNPKSDIHLIASLKKY